MELELYLNTWKTLYNNLFGFIDNLDDSQSDYQNLISDVKFQNITKNIIEFRNFLHLIVYISNNHHCCSNFFSKIDQILSFLGPQIKQTFTNAEIFQIFYKNRRILHFLIKNDIFNFEDNLKKTIKNQSYLDYFNECDEEHSEAKENGENESYICQLIRKDLIDEFIVYVHKTNISLKSTIKPSIFETNSLMMHNQLTLLEYVIFFGSINIVKYLLINEVELTESLFVYAIHSNNPEIIQLFEEKNLVPKNKKTLQKCFEESIKCHHNNIATYILENYIQNNENDVVSSYFRFFDFLKLSECEINNVFFLNACKYDYIELVKLLLNDVKIDVNYTLDNKIS